MGTVINGFETAHEIEKKGINNWWDEIKEKGEEDYGGNKINKNINAGVYLLKENVPFGKTANNVGEKIGGELLMIIEGAKKFGKES